MADPVYSFSLPSINDDTPLDCRIYHPKDLYNLLEGTAYAKAAIVAHPYAPFGGCYDDPVVLAVTETLLEQGFIVGTFNFRGAGESQGKTSWSGKAEQDDYSSLVGFLIYYVEALRAPHDSEKLEPIPSASVPIGFPTSEYAQQSRPIRLLLGGYSYGSLVLARLPPTSNIIERFHSAEIGTSPAEIILRARKLAQETNRSIEESHSLSSPRGRELHSLDSPTSPARRVGNSPITLGGEETDPSARRRSRDSRRSGDFVRRSVDLTHNIKAHIRRQSTPEKEKEEKPSTSMSATQNHFPAAVSTYYLVISPVVLPFTNSLCPPGPPSSALSLGKSNNANSGTMFLQNPTMAIFGSADGFTSSKRLKSWAKKQSHESPSHFEYMEAEGAGHFWREDGMMRALQQGIVIWMKSIHI